MARSVLISGASIAGPALAFWLHRHGFRPVVVERAAREGLVIESPDEDTESFVQAFRVGRATAH
jgi:2-polyprenyl-6-methoxyphenol hydroxylase-like FAD-dependent oxidoreductase